MEELIAALFSWLVRSIAGPRRTQRVRLSSAPDEHATPPAPPARHVPPPPITVRLPARTPASPRPAARLTPPAATVPEAPLVAALFTSPRSLAAAMVASEILQPPVALR
jgi:hypothetical protein